MISFLGYFNIVLLVIILSLFVVRRINKYGFKSKSLILKKLTKILSTIHPFLGVLMIVIAFIHGYLALGYLTLHTGVVLGGILMIQVILGILLKRSKIKGIIKIHRSFSFLLILAVIIHVFFTNIL